MIKGKVSAAKKLASSGNMWKINEGYGVITPLSYLDGFLMAYTKEISQEFSDILEFLKKRRIEADKIKIDVSGCKLYNNYYNGTAIVSSRSKYDVGEYKIRVTNVSLKNPDNKKEAFKKMRFYCKCDYAHYQIGLPVPEIIRKKFNDTNEKARIEMVMCAHANAAMFGLCGEKNCEDFGIWSIATAKNLLKFILQEGSWERSPDYRVNQIIQKYTSWQKLLEDYLIDIYERN